MKKIALEAEGYTNPWPAIERLARAGESIALELKRYNDGQDEARRPKNAVAEEAELFRASRDPKEDEARELHDELEKIADQAQGRRTSPKPTRRGA